MELLDPALIWSVAGAGLAGLAIGGEREYRGSPAGVRTHILVTLSCCLLMLSAVHQMEWIKAAPMEVIRLDPVRMAHGILTGIGFLCGGVIFREGFNVRGLTTAASLWMAATLGALFGIGFYSLAIFGTTATLVVLAAVSITERYAPQRRIAYIQATYRRDMVVSLSAFGELLTAHGLKFKTIEQKFDGKAYMFSAIVTGYDETRSEELASSWIGNRDIIGFEIKPQ